MLTEVTDTQSTVTRSHIQAMPVKIFIISMTPEATVRNQFMLFLTKSSTTQPLEDLPSPSSEQE